MTVLEIELGCLNFYSEGVAGDMLLCEDDTLLREYDMLLREGKVLHDF